MHDGPGTSRSTTAAHTPTSARLLQQVRKVCLHSCCTCEDALLLATPKRRVYEGLKLHGAGVWSSAGTRDTQDRLHTTVCLCHVCGAADELKQALLAHLQVRGSEQGVLAPLGAYVPV